MPSLEPPLWDRARSCCFTGHRPNRLPAVYQQNPAALQALRAALRDAVLQAVRAGYDCFLSGMALGTDTWAAEEVLSLKEAGYPLWLSAVIPCPEQDARWPEADRERYHSLLDRADRQVLVCPHYTAYCMHMRNRWMVEHSARLIAVYGEVPGGTANTVHLAEKKGLEIVRINPFQSDIFSL